MAAAVLTAGVVDVSIGRPIDTTGREADELMREVETWIEAEMQRLDPEAYTDKANQSNDLSKGST